MGTNPLPALRGRAMRPPSVGLFFVAALPLLAGCGDDLPPVSASDAGAPRDATPADGSIAPPTDAGPLLDASPDAGSEPDAGPAPEPPRDIFFVGNSFTFGGPVPDLVHDLATYA